MSKTVFSHEVAFSVTERKILTHHLVTRVQPKSRKQRRWFDGLFTSLSLDDFEHELKTNNVILPNDDDDKAVLAYQVGSEGLEYLLETFNVEIPGTQARAIFRIEDRLVDVKNGSYELPSELVTPQIEAAE